MDGGRAGGLGRGGELAPLGRDFLLQSSTRKGMGCERGRGVWKPRESRGERGREICVSEMRKRMSQRK